MAAIGVGWSLSAGARSRMLVSAASRSVLAWERPSEAQGLARDSLTGTLVGATIGPGERRWEPMVRGTHFIALLGPIVE
jgi:hypothetical protein